MSCEGDPREDVGNLNLHASYMKISDWYTQKKTLEKKTTQKKKIYTKKLSNYLNFISIGVASIERID